MALGRIVKDLFEGVGPFFRDVFASIGDTVLGIIPQAILQFLVDEWGFGPAMIGFLSLVLLLILIIAILTLIGRGKRRKRQR